MEMRRMLGWQWGRGRRGEYGGNICVECGRRWDMLTIWVVTKRCWPGDDICAISHMAHVRDVISMSMYPTLQPYDTCCLAKNMHSVALLCLVVRCVMLAHCTVHVQYQVLLLKWHRLTCLHLTHHRVCTTYRLCTTNCTGCCKIRYS